MSGAPVLRDEDGVAVGVVSGRYTSRDGWSRDSVWVIRIEDLLPLLPEKVRHDSLTWMPADLNPDFAPERMHRLVNVEARTARDRLGSVPSDLTFPAPLRQELQRVTTRDDLSDAVTELQEWLQETARWLEVALLPPKTDDGPALTNLVAARQRFVDAVDQLTTRREELLPPVGTSRLRAIEQAGVAVDLLAETNVALDAVWLATLRDWDAAKEAKWTYSIAKLHRYVQKARTEADQLLQRFRAEHSGVLLVEGPWGTGKTFSLATYALERAADGQATVFVTGSQLTDPQMPWLEAIARRVSANASGRDLLRALQMHSAATGRRSMIILDAVNEAANSQPHLALARLAEDVRTEPAISLVTSRRTDDARSSSWHGSDDDYGRLFHAGVDPASSWEIIRAYFKLPPVLVPWTIPDYSRPLILRMFARVIESRETDVARPIAVGALVTEWLAVLSREFALGRREGKRRNHGELSAALQAIDETESPNRTKVKQRLHNVYPLDVVDEALDFLLDEGVLREGEAGLEYALQRVGEFVRAQELLRRGAAHSALASEAECLTSVSPPDPVTSALAELAPYVVGKELLPSAKRRWKRGMAIAFAQSLQRRPAADVRLDTLARTRDLLRIPDLAGFVWFAAAVNSVEPGHPLGAGFVHHELAVMSPRRRDALWVNPVWQMLDETDTTDRSNLAEIMLWINDQADAGELTEAHARELALMLMWWLALPRRNGWYAVVRVLATLLRAYPATAAVVLAASRLSSDLDIYSGVWAALYGAQLREGSGVRSGALDGAARAALTTGDRLPLHMQLLLTAREVALRCGLPASTFTEFVRDHGQRPLRLPPAPSALLRGQPSAFEPVRHDVPHFVDPAGLNYARPLHRAVQLGLRLGGQPFVDRARRTQDSYDDPVVAKYSDQVHQTWFAEQSIRKDYVAGLVSLGGVMQPPDPSCAVKVDRHSAYFEPFADASAGVRAAYVDDIVTDVEAWFVPPIVRRLLTDGQSTLVGREDLVCTDPQGEKWWVLDANYRLILPIRRKPFPYGKVLQAWNGQRLDGPVELPAGRRLHLWAQLRSLLLPTSAATPPDRLAEFFEERQHHLGDGEWPWLLLGERLRRPPTGASSPVLTVDELRCSQPGDPLHAIRYPSEQLRRLLDLEWTGNGLTFRQGNQILLQDPAPVATAAPSLHLSQGGLTRLKTQGYRLAWHFRVVDVGGGGTFRSETERHSYWAN